MGRCRWHLGSLAFSTMLPWTRSMKLSRSGRAAARDCDVLCMRIVEKIFQRFYATHVVRQEDSLLCVRAGFPSKICVLSTFSVCTCYVHVLLLVRSFHDYFMIHDI